jgi:hypothetical protein
MGLVREILEPARFAKQLEELKAIRSQYHRDEKTSDKDTHAAGTANHEVGHGSRGQK